MKNTYIIQRILYTLFIFALVVTLCFFIPRIGVEDPCARYYPAQGNMSDENYEMIKELTKTAVRVRRLELVAVCTVCQKSFKG